MLDPQLLVSVLRAAPDAIIIVEPAGRILFASAQVTPILGYAPEELLGESVETLLPERFRTRHRAFRERYAGNAQARPMGVNLELYALRKDGSELPVEISLSPVRDADRVLVAAAIRDTSERRRIQTALTLARETADRANQAKSRFLATASHDLRQPLQTLSLLNGTLRRLALDPTAASAVQQQDQAIEAMSRLLNALLDISKLESGAIHPDPSDFMVPALFEELRVEFASIAASKGLELAVDAAPLGAHSDRALVGQILRNLVSNAIKYTPRGRVELRALSRSGSVHIEVRDTGVGIASEHLPYIYDEFYQIGSGGGAPREGYGLGLSIVQRLVQLLDLKLEVRSRPGAGSVFTLELPAARAPMIAVAAPSADQPGTPAVQQPTRVLLIDDDSGVRNATALLLRVEGFHVLAAASLAEAVQKAREAPEIDLLVSDYHLQDAGTGLDLIAAVRELRGLELPAVLVTGDTSAAVRERVTDPSIRIASKPVRADELLGLMRELLARRSR